MSARVSEISGPGSSSPVGRLLADRKKAVLARWTRMVIATYPAETASFLRSEEDPFLNPVGHILAALGKTLLEAALGKAEPDSMDDCLGDIVRVRAVQEFPPSRALSFVSIMKEAIRDEVMAEVADVGSFRELLRVESRLDEAMLTALDMYVACRGRIDEIRIREVKAEKERLSRVLAAMGCADSGPEPLGRLH